MEEVMRRVLLCMLEGRGEWALFARGAGADAPCAALLAGGRGRRVLFTEGEGDAGDAGGSGG